MIKYYLMLNCLLCSVAGAQELNMPVRLIHYVFDSFSKGKVQVKSGIISEQVLNYNMLTNEMVFDDGGRLLAIANPADVDTIFIQGRKFIPVNNKFYEVLANNTTPLLMEFTCKIEEPAVSVGYGNASTTTNTTSYTSLVGTGAVYRIKLPDDFKLITGYIFWIRKDGKYQKAGNAKQVINIFPEKKELINGFTTSAMSRIKWLIN